MGGADIFQHREQQRVYVDKLARQFQNLFEATFKIDNSKSINLGNISVPELWSGEEQCRRIYGTGLERFPNVHPKYLSGYGAPRVLPARRFLALA